MFNISHDTVAKLPFVSVGCLRQY